MRIGIDIDDVLTDTSEVMKEYIAKYDESGEVSNYLVEVMRGELPTENIKKFMAKNVVNIQKETKVKENASEVIRRLIDNGDEIIFITSRGEQKYKGSEAITIACLESNQIKYTKIIFNAYDKARICKENNIDLMIDDSVKYCEEIKKQNIDSIVFTSIVNKDIKTNIKRVNNWLELEKLIIKMRENK